MDLSLIRSITSKTSMEQIEKTLAYLGDPKKSVNLNHKPFKLVPDDIISRKLILAEDEMPHPSSVQDANPTEDGNAARKAEKNPKVDFDLDYVNMLRLENDRLATLLSLYQTKIDENLPNLKIEIDLSITDYSSAYEATVFYSKEWFAESLLSDNGKIEFANYLLGVIQSYCSVNTDTLGLISSGNADILAYIKIPRQDNS